MERNDKIMKNINDNLMKNPDLKVIKGLKDLTLLDIFALIDNLKMGNKL